jgi:hypothetical protein
VTGASFPCSLARLERDYGRDVARATYFAMKKSRDEILRVADREGIDAHQHLGADGVDLHNDFFIGYFVFTGIHLVHVLVGLLGLMLAVTRSRLGGSDRDLRLLECVSVYWHMVDLVWIVWFYLIYLI